MSHEVPYNQSNYLIPHAHTMLILGRLVHDSIEQDENFTAFNLASYATKSA